MQSKFNLFFLHLQRDIKTYLFLLTLICLYRGYFIFYMQEYISEGTNFTDVLGAMWIGFRISLKTAGAAVLISFLFCTLPNLFRPALRTDKLRIGLGYVYIAILSILFQARFPYYREFHVTFNQNIFNTFNDDAGALFITMIQEYNLPFRLITAIVLIFIVGKIFQYIMRSRCFAFPVMQHKMAERIVKLAIVIAIPIFMVFMRFGGSFNYTHSVNWENAGTTRDDFLNELILDDVQALYRANSENQMMAQGAVSNIQVEKVREYAQLVAGQHLDSNRIEDYFLKTAAGAKIPKPKHIFVIIGESYAQWPLMDQYTSLHISDGLRGIIKEENAFYSKNFLPVGSFTAQTFNGIVTGLADVGLYPTYQPETFRGAYATAIAKQFKALGYKTKFWHAGFPSSGRIKELVVSQGFDQYIGSSDLGLEKSNIWGAKDGLLFQSIEQAMAKEEEPTFNVIMTVVNHPPYNLDLQAEGFDAERTRAGMLEHQIDDKDLLNILGHYWYTDREISQFVRQLYQEEPDSLFVITGDHADRMNLIATPTMFERYTIPFVLYGKGVTKDILPAAIAGNHLNIAPTLIELIAPKGFEYYSIPDGFSKGRAIAFSKNLWMTENAIGRIEKEQTEAMKDVPWNFDFTAEHEKVDEVIVRERTVSWWRLAKGNGLE